MWWVEWGLLWRGLEISFAFSFTVVKTVHSVMKMGTRFCKKKIEDYSYLESYVHMCLIPLAQLIHSIYSRTIYGGRAWRLATEQSRLAVFLHYGVTSRGQRWTVDN